MEQSLNPKTEILFGGASNDYAFSPHSMVPDNTGTESLFCFGVESVEISNQSRVSSRWGLSFLIFSSRICENGRCELCGSW